MQIYESGREATLLDDIVLGHKTIECRLNRGKFADYEIGDQVWLRKDTYKNNELIESDPRQILVEITNIQRFPSFQLMLQAVGYKNVVPRATSVDKALDECYRFYTQEDEKEFGVLAISFVIKENH